MTPAAESRHLVRFAGGSLLVGGALAALINLVLTPLLPSAEGSVAVETSTAFGLRMPLATASVALITIGCVGLYLAQAHRLRWGSLAFLVAGIGGFMTFWSELVQATLVRDLALTEPEVWERLESAGELTRYDLTFMIGAATFAVGWLAIAAVTLRARVLPRRGALALLTGLFLVPILGGLLGIWGAVAGNLVLGSGWALLGWDCRRSADRPA